MHRVYYGSKYGQFGFRIPYLPDFLADHTLLGETEAEKLAECCRRWEYFVGSLWSLRPAAAYQLRFIYDPDRGATEVLLLGGVSDGAAADRIAAGLERAMEALRIPAEPIAAGDLADAFPVSADHVYEVRQAEQLVHVCKDARRDNAPYLVLPWWGPGGAFLGPVTALAASADSPVTLAVLLQPTELNEAADLADLAVRMATAAGAPMRGGAYGKEGFQQEHNSDPQAEWLGRVHAANLRRLHRPFLATAYVLSDDSVAARGVAGALAAAIGDELPFEPPIGEPTVIPSRADAIELEGTDRGDARRAVSELVFHFAHSGLVSASARPFERLRYLCDARGAATAFRLPVSVRGGVPGIAAKQRSPDRHPGPRVAARPEGHIELGTFEDGGLATLPVNDLTKHALITGFTGSGKTVTVLQLLHQLWADHKKSFLVLESAKQEYRGLLGVKEIGPDLRVYTLGNETAVPFRLNPFELLPGVRVEAHVSRLQVCLEAAVPPIGPSASVIADALLRVYEACGWALTDSAPETGRAKRRFPQLSEFVDAVERVLAERKYEGEVLSNLTAALVGRFRPLLIGSKRRMFDTPVSAPAATELFSRPTVLELNDLNMDDKALVVMFVLTFLREHREREFRRNPASGLAHVTLVEEAHNVLENVASKGGGDGATSADTRYKAVEAFCQMLTEIRALGEGLIIADQSPEKLAPDAMRNTNLQIAHQLRDGNDREAIANAMIMTDQQRDFLGKLAPGRAAVFRTGLEQATFVQVPRYYPDAADALAVTGDDLMAEQLRERFRGWGFSPHMTDAEVAKLMLQREPELSGRKSLPLAMSGCEMCQNQCRHRDAIFAEFDPGTEGIEDTVEWGELLAGDASETELWRFCAKTAVRGAKRAGTTAPNGDAPWCYFAHMWETRFRHSPHRKLTRTHYVAFHKQLAALRGEN